MGGWGLGVKGWGTVRRNGWDGCINAMTTVGTVGKLLGRLHSCNDNLALVTYTHTHKYIHTHT
jgi:hypothetical protein